MSNRKAVVEQLTRERILEILRGNHGVIVWAAKEMGVRRETFRKYIKEFNIPKEELCSAGLFPRPNKRIDGLRSSKTTPNCNLRLRQSRIYGTIDYICKSIFKGDEPMVAYARLVAEDGDERYKTLVEAWEQDRASGLPPAAHKTLTSLIQYAGISSIDFCKDVLGACMKRNMNISAFYAALAHPKVTRKNIAEALKSKGLRDREMFLTYTHTLPIPKSSIINVTAQAGAMAGSASRSSSGRNGESTPLPDFEEQAISGSKIIRSEFGESE